MEAKDIFEPKSTDLLNFFAQRGQGLYIPAYQRPFGWDKSKVDKLLEDAVLGYSILPERVDSFTFLGTVITHTDTNHKTVNPQVKGEVPARVLAIIDGQQRITTLLLICLALHDEVSTLHKRFLRSASKPLSDVDSFIDDEVKQLLKQLEECLFEKQVSGVSPIYPRMIRAFDDQWSKTEKKKYESPIAHLLYAYCSTFDQKGGFKLQKKRQNVPGDSDLLDRFKRIGTILRAITSDKKKDEEVLDRLPSLQDIAGSKGAQSALINKEFNQPLLAAIDAKALNEHQDGLLQLTLFGAYVLNRLAITVIFGKNEDYAFAIFESLNTTGEPLTAFETFAPRVVAAEGLGRYGESKVRESIEKIKLYLSQFKVGDGLQSATSDLLVCFAGAETGYKLPKTLPQQRVYLKEQFERHEQSEESRKQFIDNLRDVAMFIQDSWKKEGSLSFYGLPADAMTDHSKLCLRFLFDLGHSITIAPISRFYSAAVIANDQEKARAYKNLESAIKAFTAFSILWRASRRGTARIDDQYRGLLSQTGNKTDIPRLARCAGGLDSGSSSLIGFDIQFLKRELLARLSSSEDGYGKITDREKFIGDVTALPIYPVKKINRILLLAAYHDTTDDPAAPGMIVRGKDGIMPCLTFSSYIDETNLSVEHIAPQTVSAGWNAKLWESEEIVHRLGNLLLITPQANSMLQDRPWEEKKVLYRALGSPTPEGAMSEISQSDVADKIGEASQRIASVSKHMPQTVSVGRTAGDWTEMSIDARGRRLAGLAYDALMKWLL